MRTRLAALIGLALCSATAAAAAERPSFDCRKATTPSEKTICGHGRLARLDREIARAYRALRDDPDLAEPLGEEQVAFLARRDSCGSDAACLAREMENRRSALALEPSAAVKDEREAFVGRYRNAQGRMLVRRTPLGGYELSGSSADAKARWTCDVWGSLIAVREGVATVQGESDEETLVVYLQRRAGRLVVSEDPDKPLAGKSCGHNGTVAGEYRRASRPR